MNPLIGFVTYWNGWPRIRWQMFVFAIAAEMETNGTVRPVNIMGQKIHKESMVRMLATADYVSAIEVQARLTEATIEVRGL